MSGIDPFELIAKLRFANLEPLVEALRRVHQQGDGARSSLEEFLGIKREPQPSEPPAGPSAQPATNSNEVRFEELRRHFVPYAEQLRQQSILTDQLLKGFVSDPSGVTPPALQQGMRIQVSPGSSSEARFVVVNSLGKTVDLRFRRGRVHGVPPERDGSVRIGFQPELARIDAGEERLVQVTVDLAGHGDWPSALEVGVDILGSELVLMKLWIQIEVRTATEPQWMTLT